MTHKKVSTILEFWNLENEAITDIYDDDTRRKKENACYVGNSHILRRTTDIDKLKKLIVASEAVENIGVLSAFPVFAANGKQFVQDGEFFYYVSRRAPHVHVDSGVFYDGDYICNARFVGEMIGQLHLVLSKNTDYVYDGNLYENVKSWALLEAKKSLGLSDSFCNKFLNDFGNLYIKLPRQIICRNFDPRNIIYTKDWWGYIDFDFAESEIRIYDLCYATAVILSEIIGQNDEKWLDVYRNIIYGYDDIVHLTPEEYKAIPKVILANQFVCVALLATHKKNSELNDKNIRIAHWLIDRLEYLIEL